MLDWNLRKVIRIWRLERARNPSHERKRDAPPREGSSLRHFSLVKMFCRFPVEFSRGEVEAQKRGASMPGPGEFFWVRAGMLNE